MNLLKRLKNIWELSAYRPDKGVIAGTNTLTKDIPTIKKKLAKIIPDDTRNILEKELDENNGETA